MLVRLAWRTVVAGAAAALAACAAPVDFPVVGASADVEFPRTLAASRTIEVHLPSVGGEDVMVTGGTLFSPLFERLDAVEVGVRVYPGHDARVRLPLGAAVCPAGAGDSSAQLAIEVGGEEVVQSVRLDDAVLVRIHEDECRVRDATEAATPSLGASGGLDGDTVRTSIVLTRGTSLLPVSIDQATGSVIFSVDVDDGDLPATLLSTRERLEVPMRVRVARCDPHAFAESKQTFLFKVWMTVEGGAQTYVELQAEGPLRDDLQALFDACGEASRAR